MGLVRHCRQCGSDYRPEISRCAVCDIALEDRFEETDPRFAPQEPPVPEPAAPVQPDDHETIYFSHTLPDIQALASLLDARGIAFVIRSGLEPQKCGPPRERYELAVRDVERAAAREELRRLQSETLPSEATDSVDCDFDPSDGYARCPACSATLTPGASECPGCGLGLGGGEELRCSACGIAVGPGDARCPGCDNPF